MSKKSPSSNIRTLADLKAREARLKQEMQLAKLSALQSANASRKKFSHLLFNRAAPVAAAGLGLAVAYHFFGKKKQEDRTSKTPRQKSAWADLFMLLLPLLKLALPAAQAWYKDFASQKAQGTQQAAATRTAVRQPQ